MGAFQPQVNALEEDMKDSPLFSVIKTSDVAMLELLLEANCDPMARADFGKGALHAAAYVTFVSDQQTVHPFVASRGSACKLNWTCHFCVAACHCMFSHL